MNQVLPPRIVATLRALDCLGFGGPLAAWGAILLNDDWVERWPPISEKRYPDGRRIACILISAEDIAIINSYRAIQLSL